MNTNGETHGSRSPAVQNDRLSATGERDGNGSPVLGGYVTGVAPCAPESGSAAADGRARGVNSPASQPANTPREMTRRNVLRRLICCQKVRL